MPEIPTAYEQDIHGLEYAADADLAVLFAGNQYPVVPALLEAFKRRYPKAQLIFYETLPPGLLAEQIREGSATFRGSSITIGADVYLSTTRELMEGLAEDGLIDLSEAHPYVKNRLVLMVAAGNPKNISSLEDLGRDDVRISMPDPKREGIASYILQMYRDFGGESLERYIMQDKLQGKTTTLTTVHHRETPERLETGDADVGPVWITEYEELRATNRALEPVEVGSRYDQQHDITYYIAPLKQAPHPELAQHFVDFVLGPTGQRIYARHGFVPAVDHQKRTPNV